MVHPRSHRGRTHHLLPGEGDKEVVERHPLEDSMKREEDGIPICVQCGRFHRWSDGTSVIISGKELEFCSDRCVQDFLSEKE